MAIIPVKKISLFFLKEATASIFSLLQNKNILEIKEKNYEELSAQHEGINSYNFHISEMQKADTQASEFSNYLSSLDKIINLLEKHRSKKTFLQKLNDKIFISENEFQNIQNIQNVQKIKDLCFDITAKIKKLDEINSKKLDLLDKMHEIKPWLGIHSELDEIFATAFTRTIAGIMQKDKYVEFCNDFINESVVIFKAKDTEKDVYFLTIADLDILEKVKEIIAKNGKIIHWESFKLQKSPTEILENLNRVFAVYERKEANINRWIKKYASYLNAFKIEYDRVYNEWLRYKKNEDMAIAKNVCILTGWIRESDLVEFEKDLEKAVAASFLAVEEPKVGEEIPVAFENSKTAYPFEIITDLYGRPTYSGIDPTPFLTPFFFLYFGMCSADAGYGLFMIISAIFAIKFTKENPILEKAAKLFLYLGIATFSIGIITGSFFGNMLNLLPQSLSFIKDTLNRFVLINPLDEKGSLMFLVFALFFGYIQLCFGICLKIFLLLRDKNYKSLFLEGLSALGVQLSLLPITLYFVLGVKFLPILVMNFIVGILCVSVILIGYNEWRKNEGIMIKLFWCLYGNYSAITGTFLSDTLSYARLFALGLSGGLLALAINEISGVFKDIPVFGVVFMILVMICGHLFNLAIGIMGAFVHSCRLQYLEFFTKFFESGGRAFRPFCRENKYTVLK